MTDYVQISDVTLSALKEASKLEEGYISCGLYQQCFMIACEGIRGILSSVPVEETTHEEFHIRVDKKILLQIFKRGYIKVEFSEENKICKIKNYRTRDSVSPWLVSTIPSCITPAIINQAKLVVDGSNNRARISREVISQKTLSLLDMTESTLQITDNIAFSLGKGFGFAKEFFDCDMSNNFSIDYKSLKMILKNITDTSVMCRSGNTWIMRNPITNYTWRAPYYSEMDIQKSMSLEPYSVYKLSVEADSPFISESTPKKDNVKAVLSINDKTLTVSVSDYEIKVKVCLDTVVETKKVECITIDQKYLQFIASTNSLIIKVFKHAVHIYDEDSGTTIFIGCDVLFSINQ